MTRQMMIALVIVFGATVTAHAKQSYKPLYKVENCDCMGVDQEVPTFLSDLVSSDFTIEATARSRKAAEKKADRMCVQAYRDFASEISEDDAYSIKSNYGVSSTGCRLYKTTRNGDWKAL